MANDEREEERAFLAGLKARTGRDLAEWMAAITAQGFHDKNEIIDWLRTQRLPFARASWLERIHRNGGKPIHAGSAPSAPAAPAGSDPAGLTPGQSRPIAAPATEARPVAAPPRLVVMTPAPRPAPVPPQAIAPPQQSMLPQPAVSVPKVGPETVGPAKGSDPQGLTPSSTPSVQAAPKTAKKAVKPPPLMEPPADPAALEKLVAAAKGYRPLYHHLEAQIRRVIPGAVIAARDRYVAIGAPLEFAAITLHPTEIRLGLALDDHPFDAPLQPAKLRGPGPAITHMLALTDARQVNDDLLGLLQAANARVNADGGQNRGQTLRV
jgi:hypothetical protein